MPHTLLETKSGCCSCLALAGAEATVCDCAPSNCQLLCQKCHLTCCSLLHARSYSFQQLRAGNMPQTALHSLPLCCQPLLSPSLLWMTSSFYPPTQHSLFSDLNKQLTQTFKFDFLGGPFWGMRWTESHNSSNYTKVSVSPRCTKVICGKMVSTGWTESLYFVPLATDAESSSTTMLSP